MSLRTFWKHAEKASRLIQHKEGAFARKVALHTNIMTALSWQRRTLLCALIGIILCHNLIFQNLLLSVFSLSTLRSSFPLIQLARHATELLLIFACLYLIGRPFATWTHVSWKSREALAPISAVLLLMSALALLLRLLPATAALPSRTLTLESQTWTPIFIHSVLITPFREELFFRGLLWTLLAGRMPRAQATLVSAFLFSSAHLPPFDGTAFCSQFAFGTMLAFVLPRYGLGVCVAIHMAFNAWVLAWHEASAPLRAWLVAHPLVYVALCLPLLTLFFRGLYESLVIIWTSATSRIFSSTSGP